MNRSTQVAVSLVAVVGLFDAVLISPETAAEDGPQATISALQTRVAELETQVAGGLVATRSSDATVPAAAGRENASPFVGGDAAHLVPEGEAGKLSVVAVGPYDGFYLPVVVRNNTDAAMISVQVEGSAHSADGTLLAVSGASTMRPNLVGAGEVALGDAYFGGTDLPADATFELEAEGQPYDGAGASFVTDLEAVEASVRDDRILGRFRNAADETVRPITASVVCFDEDGALLRYYQASAFDESQVLPGEAVAFEIPLVRGDACPSFLVAATGAPV